jgi:hypothetical protein
MWLLRCRNISVFIDGVLEFQTQDPSKKFTYELFLFKLRPLCQS